MQFFKIDIKKIIENIKKKKLYIRAKSLKKESRQMEKIAKEINRRQDTKMARKVSNIHRYTKEIACYHL